MKDAAWIIKEIKELESRLNYLKAELQEIQGTCQHSYISNSLMSTCTLCMKSEIHYY